MLKFTVKYNDSWNNVFSQKKEDDKDFVVKKDLVSWEYLVVEKSKEKDVTSQIESDDWIYIRKKCRFCWKYHD